MRTPTPMPREGPGTPKAGPSVSAILATDRFETMSTMVDRLAAQEGPERIELVFITPDVDGVRGALDRLAVFSGVRTVEVDGIDSLSAARALGVKAASAPIILMAETHAFPQAGWCDAVIEAHRDADLVVPAFENANPRSPLSWSGFLADYGSFGCGREPGPLTWWPGFNATYDRSKLLALGDSIEGVVTSGPAAWDTLPALGWRVRFDPRAEIHHLNVDLWRCWLEERFSTGAVLAAGRSREWSWPKRLLYALASPLIVPVLMWRTREGLRLARARTRVPLGTTLAWACGMVVRVLGEVTGYVFGRLKGPSRRLLEYELFKAQYTRDGE